MKKNVKLDTLTKKFFKLYWNGEMIGHPPPKWTTWHLENIPPEASMAGCYAIYAEDELRYIGSAVTEGKNFHRTGEKYGLLKRLERHVIRKQSRGSNLYVPFPPEKKLHWKGITCIRLIGFPDAHRHLAAALEFYLINRLAPSVNAQVRWRAEP
jgi:hypothetical protein